MKTILLAGAVMLGLLPSARAYSLAGPVGNGGDKWQATEIGYGPPRDFVAPKNLGEEYRRNTPVMYYAFDAQFLGYFGTDGMAAVDKAFAIMNSLTNVSSYSANLSEFPVESRHVNYQAQALGLYDMKSATLGILMGQMGLADPVSYIWDIHDRYHVPGAPACPVGMEYLVVQRNFDIVSSPLNQIQYSAYVNDVLYSYQILEVCAGSPILAEAVPYSADPLADSYAPVASTMIGLGDFYTGLTRDDVAGLRYLLQTNNVNWETAPADSLQFVITTNTTTPPVVFPPYLYGVTNSIGTNGGGYFVPAFTNALGAPIGGYGDLTAFLDFAKTNDPATLQAAYPGLAISSYSYTPSIVSNAYYTAYYTNPPVGSPYGTPPVLVVKTNYYLVFQLNYNYIFANVFTNHYGKGVAKLVTVTVGTLPGSPYGSPGVTNTTVKNLSRPAGDFFILPLFYTNVCPIDILPYGTITNVLATTNLLTTVFTNTATTNLSSYVYVITYFTNYSYLIAPTSCSTIAGATGSYQGIEKIKFVNAQSDMTNYDSGLDQFVIPITNNYSMVYRTAAGQLQLHHFQRIVTKPDFLFSAQDMVSGPGGIPVVATYGQTLGFDTANVLPGLAGPGTITTPTTITFEKAGPVYFNDTDTSFGLGANMDGTPYFNQTPGNDTTNLFYTGYFLWASYDGTTNDPVVWPNGTSIDSLENQILIQVSPAAIPAATNGYAYTSSNPLTTFTVTGGFLSQPYTWSATGLPAEWSVTPDGMLVGTPTATGTNAFTLILTDSLSVSVQWNYSLTIIQP